jgi:hypothetical protein
VDYLKQVDVLVALDVRDIYWAITHLDKITRKTTYLTPPKMKLAEVGLERTFISKWSVDFGKFMEADVNVLADTALAMPAITEHCRRLLAQQPDRKAAVERRRDEIAGRHEALRKSWMKEAEKDWEKSPLGTARLAQEVWDVIKNEDWVLTTGDLNDWARRIWSFDSSTATTAARWGPAPRSALR